MRVAQPLVHVEPGATGIEQAADKQPAQRPVVEVHQDRLDRDDHQPAHADIDQGRHQLEASGEEQLEDHAKHRQRPDRAEHPPAPGFAQADQGDRCVGAGDQQIDGTVIKHLQTRLGIRMRNGVIQRRRRVQQHERDAIDDGTAELPDITTHRCQGDQHRRTTQRRNDPKSMRQRIRKLFAQGMSFGHGSNGSIL